MQISFFCYNLAILLFSEIVILWSIDNKTFWRLIQSVIILAVNKSDPLYSHPILLSLVSLQTELDSN